jgi:tellurite resistance protein
MRDEEDTNGIANEQLSDLQARAGVQDKQFRQIRQELWALLADVYLWWRQANERPGYLDEQFAARGITFYEKANDINFAPVIRLIWDIEHPNASDRVRMTKWSKVLRKFHDEFETRPADFARNTKGKLTALIAVNGGIAQYGSGEQDADEKSKGKSDFEFEKPRPAVNTKKTNEISDKAVAEFALIKLQSQTEVIATAKAVEPVRTNDDGLTVLIARRNAQGELLILGSSNDKDLIGDAARKIVPYETFSLDLSLRSLVETIATQTYPSMGLPAEHKRSEWILKKLNDKVPKSNKDLEGWDTQDEKKRKLTSGKRVHVLNEGKTIVIAGSMIAASPVTTCHLEYAIAPAAPDLFMRTRERPAIEDWIRRSHTSLMHPNPKRELLESSAKEKSTRKLIVRNASDDSEKQFHFYEIDPQRFTHKISRFNRSKFFDACRIDLTIDWFNQVRATWVDRWFEKLGNANYIIRPENKVLTLTLSETALSIKYANGDAPFPFPTKAAITRQVDPVRVLSKDFVPILNNLANVNCIGGILFMVSDHAVVFEYKTTLGAFEIAVPTLTADTEQRDETLFQLT